MFSIILNVRHLNKTFSKYYICTSKNFSFIPISENTSDFQVLYFNFGNFKWYLGFSWTNLFRYGVIFVERHSSQNKLLIYHVTVIIFQNSACGDKFCKTYHITSYKKFLQLKRRLSCVQAGFDEIYHKWNIR